MAACLYIAFMAITVYKKIFGDWLKIIFIFRKNVKNFLQALWF